MMKPQLYNGASIETMIKSFKDSFVRSSTLGTHSNFKRFLDSGGLAQAGSYLEQQMTYKIPTILKQEYPDKPALSIIGVSNEGSIEKALVRRIKGFAGEHKRKHENKTSNKGIITVAYDATGMLIEDFGAVSNYEELDLLRAAAGYSDSLDASVLEAHDESFKTVADSVAWLGMTDDAGNTLVEGLLNNSNVDTDLVKDASGVFSTANGITMYSDIKRLYTAIAGKANGVQGLVPNTLVTDPATKALLDTTTYGVASENFQSPVTISEMCKNYLGITEIRATSRATGLGGSSKNLICLFNRDEKNMKLYIPKPLTFADVFKKGFSYEIESMFRIAGLGINHKTAFGYLKGC